MLVVHVWDTDSLWFVDNTICMTLETNVMVLSYYTVFNVSADICNGLSIDPILVLLLSIFSK